MEGHRESKLKWKKSLGHRWGLGNGTLTWAVGVDRDPVGEQSGKGRSIGLDGSCWVLLGTVVEQEVGREDLLGCQGPQYLALVRGHPDSLEL